MSELILVVVIIVILIYVTFVVSESGGGVKQYWQEPEEKEIKEMLDDGCLHPKKKWIHYRMNKAYCGLCGRGVELLK